MNLVGKIFTVLIFVMSVVFASFCVMVYGAHVNWRTVVKNTEASAETPLGLEPQLQNSKADNAELQNQLTKTVEDSEQKRKSDRRALTTLETTKRQLEDRLKVQDDEVARLTKLEREATATITAIGASLANLRGEVALVRETLDATETDRDDQFKQVVRLTEELHAKANDFKVLLEQARRLTEDLIRVKGVARAAGLNTEAPVGVGIPPLVEGKVLAVRADQLIEISIGSDDGLAVGHQLHVYRVLPTVNTYLGKVRVTAVRPDTAVCLILNDYRKGAVQVGDDVATKLSTGS